MKQISYLSFCILLVGMFSTSCNKALENSEPKRETVVKKVANIPGQYSPQYVILAQNGEYTSSYGAGITFSATFPHPIIVDLSGATDGEPVVGYQNVAYQNVPTLSSTIDGARFAIVQPTFPNAVTMTQVGEYLTALNAYWDDKTGTVPMPPPLASSYGSGGVIEVRGMVVRDHNSPTNVSVVSDTYHYTAPPVLLCNLYKSGYLFTFYGTLSDTGAILKLTGKDDAN